MTFQAPSALLWLAPLGGVIVLLYLLKMRRRDLRVPATFLWPAKTEEIRANALFQKLRFSWLLVLQLLALTLVVICLAKPQSRQTGLTGDVTVLVLDSSASMGATDVRPSRFAEAKRLAEQAIRSAKPTDRIAMIEAGPTPRVVFPLSSESGRQLQALQGVQQTDADADVGEALRLAAALVGGVDGARIVLLSDGDFAPIRDFSPGKAAVTYRAIGETDENLAISALGLAETQTGRQLFCGVQNHSRKKMGGTLTLYADGNAVDSIKFQVAPSGQWGHTIAAAADAKVFEAKLDAPDVLKADNYAVCLANPGASLRVLLVSHGNLFLERALALDPRVTLDRAETVPADGAAAYDVVVFDGIQELPVKARGVLAFGAAGPSSPVKAIGSLKAPQVVSVETVPLLKGVDLRGVFVDHAEKVTPKANGRVLADTGSGPLIVDAESPSQKQIFVAFDPLQSDFPLQVGFPIFIGNALDYLGGATTSDLLAVKAGAPFVVPAATATLKTPDGETLELKGTGNNLVVREVRRIGEYQLKSAGKTRKVYAMMRSERSSDVAPVKNLALGGSEVKATSSPARFADLWRLLAVIGLLVLSGEWWMFARRS